MQVLSVTSDALRDKCDQYEAKISDLNEFMSDDDTELPTLDTKEV